MAYDLRKLTIFGAVGFLLATSIILSVQLYTPFMPIVTEGGKGPASQSQEPSSQSQGPTSQSEAKSLLVIKVKDAPAMLKALFLKIDGVRVHRGGKGEGEGPWMNVTVVATEPFDLLTLRDVATVLAAEELPVGNYTEIRLHVVSANATIDGEKVPLKIRPETGWLMVKIHFTLEEQGVTTILIDIDVNEEPIIHAKILTPVVKATVEKIGASMPVQNHYRWANNDDAESPTWKADQDSPITGVALTGAVLRMRLSIKNVGFSIWSGVQLKLQYNTSLTGDWRDVDAQGGAGIWRYSNGLGTDKAIVKKLFLTGSSVNETFVESSPTATIIKIPIGGQGEWDICIVSNGAVAGKTYYFRFVLSDGTPLNAYEKYPTLTTAT